MTIPDSYTLTANYARREFGPNNNAVLLAAHQLRHSGAGVPDIGIEYAELRDIVRNTSSANDYEDIRGYRRAAVQELMKATSGDKPAMSFGDIFGSLGGNQGDVGSLFTGGKVDDKKMQEAMSSLQDVGRNAGRVKTIALALVSNPDHLPPATREKLNVFLNGG